MLDESSSGMPGEQRGFADSAPVIALIASLDASTERGQGRGPPAVSRPAAWLRAWPRVVVRCGMAKKRRAWAWWQDAVTRWRGSEQTAAQFAKHEGMLWE
jgi:hypothetical protein